MGASRPTPHPTSLRPETGAIDETWDDLVLGAIGDSGAPLDPGIFDRATTIPKSPPTAGSGQEVDFESEPPDAFRLPSEPPPLMTIDAPGSGRAALLPDAPRAGAAGLAASTARTVSPGMSGRLPLPGRGPEPERYDPKQTAAEPSVDRYLARLEAGVPQPAEARNRNVDLEETDADLSPLDLVETYRRRTESQPGQIAAPPPDQNQAGARESGTLQDMQDRYAVGDFTGALVVAESILDTNPDHEDALRYAQSCREVLTQMYAARIGPMDQVAVVAVPADQITWLSLDHRAGFLLSLVDGVSSIEEILDVSGMTRLDALRIMYTLVQQNVITLSH